MSVEKKNVTVRVPQDTYEAFEDYRGERNITKADAGRRLLEEGLDAETTPDHASRLTLFASLATVFAVLVTGFWVALQFASVSGFGLFPEIAVAWCWVVAGVAQLVDLRDRHEWLPGGSTGGE